MIKYIIKRILWLIPVVLGVAVLIFAIMYFTPGDPVELMLAGNPTQAQIEAKRIELGLADPFFIQLLRFLKQTFLQFNLGTSYSYNNSVMGELLERLPRTATIASICCIMQVLIGIPLGVTAATHQNKWQDHICIVLAMIGTSLPEFWIALMLILTFSLQLGWLPSYGIDSLKCYILPCIALGIGGLGSIARQTRSQMLEVIRADYITTARAKGVSEKAILYKHALPNALIPIVTGIGTSFGTALGGAVVIETIFSIPGTGMYMVDAIGARDYPAIRGSVVFLAVLFSFVILLVDLVYAYIDPRIKAQYEGQQRRRKKSNG